MNPIRWRDRILVNFPSPGPSLTLVADPDGLLQEPELRTALAFRGYQVLDYEDPVLFRVRFERDFFPLLEDPGGLQVAVRTDAGRRLEDLPADLLPRGRRLNLSLAGLFPRLSYPVLQRLGAGWLDRLEEAGAGERGPSLGPEATLDFLTRQVFGLHLRDLRQPTRLVARLLEMHYHQEGVPDQIARRVARELAGEPDLGAWPLERLWSDRAAFLSFLQEQWEVFLRSLQQPDHGSVCEPAATLPPRSLVPFQAPQVRVFVDTLFLEGLLQPVRLDDGATLPAAEAWAQVGIRGPGPEDAQRRLEALLARSRESEFGIRPDQGRAGGNPEGEQGGQGRQGFQGHGRAFLRQQRCPQEPARQPGGRLQAGRSRPCAPRGAGDQQSPVGQADHDPLYRPPQGGTVPPPLGQAALEGAHPDGVAQHQAPAHLAGQVGEEGVAGQGHPEVQADPLGAREALQQGQTMIAQEDRLDGRRQPQPGQDGQVVAAGLGEPRAEKLVPQLLAQRPVVPTLQGGRASTRQVQSPVRKQGGLFQPVQADPAIEAQSGVQDTSSFWSRTRGTRTSSRLAPPWVSVGLGGAPGLAWGVKDLPGGASRTWKSRGRP